MEERRRSPRFKILQPAAVSMQLDQSGELSSPEDALVHNAAINGVLVLTKRAIPLGTVVEVTIFLPHELRASCAGKVVRVSDSTADGNVGLGIECTRPFTEPVRAAEPVT